MNTRVLLILFVAACIRSAAQIDTLTILHVNDTHSNLMPLAPRNQDLSGTRGGIARVATYVSMTRASERNILFLHAGDISIGDPMYNMYFGVPEYALLSQMGLDAMAVGNHEFDLTPSTLRSALDSAALQGFSFPLLAANLILDDPGVVDLKAYIKPRVIIPVGDLKVGVFGMITPETMLLSLPGPAAIDTSADAVGLAAAGEIAALAAETCDVIIMLSHLGHYYDRLVAENVPGINVIVGGHDHELIETPHAVVNPSGDTTWIVQAGAFYEYVGHLRLTIDAGTVSVLDYEPVPMNEDIPENQDVKELVGLLAQEQEAAFGIPFFSEAIGVVQSTQWEVISDLTGRREASSPVTQLVTAAFADTVRTDIALTVAGATAQPLWEGPITPADLFRMVGYGFNTENYLGYRLATFSLSGLDLMKGLEWGLSSIELNDEYFVVGHGLRYVYDPTKPSYERLDSVFVNDLPIQLSAQYSIVANEFVLSVVRDFLAPQLGLTIIDDTVLAMTEFEAVLAYVLKTQVITDAEESVDPNTVPLAFRLEQNYPNPFNPSTTIRYSLRAEGFVQLTVFDLLGRRVESLVNENQTAGIYSVTWEPKVPTGIYFCTLEVADYSRNQTFRSLKRMVLIK